MSKFLFHAAVIGGAMLVAMPADAATLFTIAPDLSRTQTSSVAYNSIFGNTTFAAQLFTLGSAATVDGFGFNSVLYGGTPATSTNYRVLRASDTGTPGAVITSGLGVLTSSVGPTGFRAQTTDYRFSVSPLSLAAGSYFLAFRVVTINDEDSLSKGVATSGAFSSIFGDNNTFRRDGDLFPSAAISVFGTETVVAAPVPEPATWAMMLFGFGGLGYALRRRGRAHIRIRFA